MPAGIKRKRPLKVLYTGALTDLSGYAEAAREGIHCLDEVGIDVAGDSRIFEPQSQYLVEEVVTRRLWSLLGKDHNCPIQILHLTPDNYSSYRNEARIKIGTYAWETSKVPPLWVKNINEIDKNYKNKRFETGKIYHKYFDGKSTERLLKFLKIIS